jgi:hypothetical protein
MNQYFIDATFYVTKNSAHQQAQKIAMNYNHCLIDEKRLENLIESFSLKVDAINKANKRCKDIKLEHWKFELPGHESQHISIEGNFSLSITLVKRFELSKSTGRDPIYDLMGDMKAH